MTATLDTLKDRLHAKAEDAKAAYWATVKQSARGDGELDPAEVEGIYTRAGKAFEEFEADVTREEERLALAAELATLPQVEAAIKNLEGEKAAENIRWSAELAKHNQVVKTIDDQLRPLYRQHTRLAVEVKRDLQKLTPAPIAAEQKGNRDRRAELSRELDALKAALSQSGIRRMEEAVVKARRQVENDGRHDRRLIAQLTEAEQALENCRQRVVEPIEAGITGLRDELAALDAGQESLITKILTGE